MDVFKSYLNHLPAAGTGASKSTLFSSPRLLLGLNRLEPGSVQSLHIHDGQDKFYHVIEGVGAFTVGTEVREGGVGFTVWAPSGVDHGVANRGSATLLLLVGIAPAPTGSSSKSAPTHK